MSKSLIITIMAAIYKALTINPTLCITSFNHPITYKVGAIFVRFLQMSTLKLIDIAQGYSDNKQETPGSKYA